MEKKISVGKLSSLKKNNYQKEGDQYIEQYKDTLLTLRNEFFELKDLYKNQNLLLKIHEQKNSEESILLKYNSFSNKNLVDNETNTPNEKEKFISEDDINKIDYVTPIENKIDPFISNELHKVSSEKEFKPMLRNDIYSTYVNILKTNADDLSNEDLEDFEEKMESLYFDKLNLEANIRKGVEKKNIEEKYTIVRAFYEKFIELLNDKLVENIEKGAMLKINIKKFIDDSTQNKSNISKNELLDKINKNKNITDTLKRLMIKFISNTQLKEVNELKEKYENLLKEKHILQTNNKKYQDNLAETTKDKEEKCQNIFVLSNELNKLKRIILLRLKREKDMENKFNNIENALNPIKAKKNIEKKNLRKLLQNQIP